MISTSPYKNFILGRYFSEGLRLTIGISLPVIIASFLGYQYEGIIIATGALCVSVTDSPGPLHHRINGMFFCTLIIAAVSIISFFAFYTILTTVAVIILFGFIFSMLAVYNARVASVGIAALLVMILSMQNPLQGSAIFTHTGYIVTGGIWYLIFSVSLNRLRPYRIIQQVSADFITDVSHYLRTRAGFYGDHPDYESIYNSLLKQQVSVQTAQATLTEMLFKTREITKNSTQTGRSLLKIYIDVADLFESIMSAFQQYELLHQQFDHTGILDEYRRQLILLSDELLIIADAVRAGTRSAEVNHATDNLVTLRKKFEILRATEMSAENLQDYISLGRIFNNIRGLTQQIHSLHHYTGFNKTRKPVEKEISEAGHFTEEQTIEPQLFLNNLNFHSNIFRHSLRVAISLATGYLLSVAFHIGHSYWILLTIVVILKPAYSLTKSRNADRLAGTMAGIVIGVGILLVVKNQDALFVLMMILMAGGYMFLRTRYFLSVLLMTPYLVIFFHILSPGNIKEILVDRTIDTALGSAIAFISSLFFVPAWEHTTIHTYMINMLKSNIEYFDHIALSFSSENEMSSTERKKLRRQNGTALANLSDAFNRMLSEPKRFQKNAELIHRFVVLNHIITSHFSALSFYLNEHKEHFKSPLLPVAAAAAKDELTRAINILENGDVSRVTVNNDPFDLLDHETEPLLAQRRLELANGMVETETKKMLIAKRSVIDQFVYIRHLSKDIRKNAEAFTA